MFEVLSVFFRLGLTSFGGPVAHLGYFHEEFVQRRGWMSEQEYADLVALCQFMPGPASSQVGMAIGLRRAGYPGLVAAWVGFTLPSVVVIVAFALGVAKAGDLSNAGWLLGLKAAAVAVVAQAVLGMTKSIVTDKLRVAVALGAFIAVLLVPHPLVQVAVIAAGMLAGILALPWAQPRDDAPPSPSAHPPAQQTTTPTTQTTMSTTPPGSRVTGIVALAIFGLLLLALPVVAGVAHAPGATIFESFYRAGALVFGGGHVVLPLLEQATVPTGLVDHDTFLAGYGAAQAVPGPLFTFASYLGASATGIPWLWGATVATVAIFLPAALLVIGIMPFWDRLRAQPRAADALAGANAAVVGILAAALYNPVFLAGVNGPATMAIAAAAFVALHSWKLPAWAVVIAAALTGWAVL